VTQALDRVRKAARLKKKERFTTLLHHVTVDTLQTAFYALKRKATAGVDGMTWVDYEADLEPRLMDLHPLSPESGPPAPQRPVTQRDAVDDDAAGFCATISICFPNTLIGLAR
jgi:hypothetical protein